MAYAPPQSHAPTLTPTLVPLTVQPEQANAPAVVVPVCGCAIGEERRKP